MDNIAKEHIRDEAHGNKIDIYLIKECIDEV